MRRTVAERLVLLLREENAVLREQLDAQAAMLPKPCLCRYCQQERVEEAVLRRHPLPQMTPIGLGRCLFWARA